MSAAFLTAPQAARRIEITRRRETARLWLAELAKLLQGKGRFALIASSLVEVGALMTMKEPGGLVMRLRTYEDGLCWQAHVVGTGHGTKYQTGGAIGTTPGAALTTLEDAQSQIMRCCLQPLLETQRLAR